MLHSDTRVNLYLSSISGPPLSRDSSLTQACKLAYDQGLLPASRTLVSSALLLATCPICFLLQALGWYLTRPHSRLETQEAPGPLLQPQSSAAQGTIACVWVIPDESRACSGVSKPSRQIELLAQEPGVPRAVLQCYGCKETIVSLLCCALAVSPHSFCGA